MSLLPQEAACSPLFSNTGEIFFLPGNSELFRSALSGFQRSKWVAAAAALQTWPRCLHSCTESIVTTRPPPSACPPNTHTHTQTLPALRREAVKLALQPQLFTFPKLYWQSLKVFTVDVQISVRFSCTVKSLGLPGGKKRIKLEKNKCIVMGTCFSHQQHARSGTRQQEPSLQCGQSTILALSRTQTAL